jgi:hypothetical protein
MGDGLAVLWRLETGMGVGAEVGFNNDAFDRKPLLEMMYFQR